MAEQIQRLTRITVEMCVSKCAGPYCTRLRESAPGGESGAGALAVTRSEGSRHREQGEEMDSDQESSWDSRDFDRDFDLSVCAHNHTQQPSLHMSSLFGVYVCTAAHVPVTLPLKLPFRPSYRHVCMYVCMYVGR